jgi:two-component system, LytTR family, response regulator
VFLDIEMPAMNGFEMLEQFEEIPFAVIYYQLLKPVDQKNL